MRIGWLKAGLGWLFSLRDKALDALEATTFYPAQGRNRIHAMISGRPDWCISRQRAWGVPIAVFVEKKSGEPLRDPVVMTRILDAFRVEGADAWYQPGAAQRAKELLQIGEREHLSRRDLREADRRYVLAGGRLGGALLAGSQFDHGHDGISAAR